MSHPNGRLPVVTGQADPQLLGHPCAQRTQRAADAGRARLAACLDESIARGGEFVRRRVEAGEAAFIDMWESLGGQERFDRRRRRWRAEARDLDGIWVVNPGPAIRCSCSSTSSQANRQR